jgi:hypothetical protein
LSFRVFKRSAFYQNQGIHAARHWLALDAGANLRKTGNAKNETQTKEFQKSFNRDRQTEVVWVQVAFEQALCDEAISVNATIATDG